MRPRGPRGKPFPLSQIFPNRHNPNEMDHSERFRLQEAVKEDEYDPIIISPARTFYPPEVFKTIYVEDESGTQRWLKAIPGELYIICDGEHRYGEAKTLEMTEIRVLIWHMTEKDAMPYFYKRHAIRGNHVALKEAKLFLHENRVNKKSLAQIKEDYNLSSISFIKGRVGLTKVSPRVVDLFWEPPEDAPGSLTISQLLEIGTLKSHRWQHGVAMMTLYRNWNRDDTRKEIRRIKQGKGVQDPKAYLEAVEKPPPARPIGESRSRVKTSPLIRKEPLSDEEVFKEYPDSYLGEEKEEETKPKPILVTDERVEVIRDDYVVQRTNGRLHKEKRLKTVVREAPPPLVINSDLMDPLMKKVLLLGVQEGFNLRAQDQIGGMWPNQVLREKLKEHMAQFEKGELSVLPFLILRALQIWIRDEEMQKTRDKHK